MRLSTDWTWSISNPTWTGVILPVSGWVNRAWPSSIGPASWAADTMGGDRQSICWLLRTVQGDRLTTTPRSSSAVMYGWSTVSRLLPLLRLTPSMATRVPPETGP